MSINQQRTIGSRRFDVVRNGDPVPPQLRGAVIAIGNFDGIHLGHRQLVETSIAAARSSGRSAAVLTFEPHPRKFFAPDRPMFRLTPEPVKLTILDKLGLDGVFVRRFDAQLAGTSAAGFVTDLLRDELHVGGVAVGYDFHFGRGREGTPAMLAELCRRHGIDCELVPAVAHRGEPVSSTAIRSALAAGDVPRANALLGYRWFVEGEVRHGDKRGRELGFPTANMSLGEDCELRHGIYAVRVGLGPGDIREGVANFGRRPTFDNGAPLLEVHVFDFDGELYGRRLQVEFVAWIRGEERFPSAEALVARMREDARQARASLACAPAEPISFIG
ncbi:MAG TPA: bifunctional riboflavin kinase/FAD synthetase [Beijerinckiaceae bacterium]|jgi:riboflavin kinase/FMN adenylyltransferase